MKFSIIKRIVVSLLCVAIFGSSYIYTSQDLNYDIACGISAVFPKNGGTATNANELVRTYCDTYDAHEFNTDTTSGYDTSTAVGATLEKCIGTYEEEQYYPEYIKLEWTCDSEAEYYIVALSSDSDLNYAKYIKTTNNYLNIMDLFSDYTYYWQVKAVTSEGEILSRIFSFTTGDYIRAVEIEGLENTRDFGGKDTIDGGKTKQGVVYRGGTLSDATDAGKDKLLNTLGVVTDLDVKGSSKSGLGNDIQKFYAFEGSVYNANWLNGLAEQLRVFADSSNYPIYFHCQIGRDRTGTLGILLNGLLGVSQEDTIKDYMFSTLSSVGNNEGYDVGAWYNGFIYGNSGSFIRGIQAQTGKEDFNEACYQYCLHSLFLTEDEINAIRVNLLEDGSFNEKSNCFSINTAEAQFVETYNG